MLEIKKVGSSFYRRLHGVTSQKIVVFIVAISTCSPSLETGLFASSRPLIRPSVRIYQRGSKCTDFREIWYWGLLGKYISRKSKRGSNRAKISDTFYVAVVAFFCFRRN